jgi:hypothetical protein
MSFYISLFNLLINYNNFKISNLKKKLLYIIYNIYINNYLFIIYIIFYLYILYIIYKIIYLYLFNY